MRVIAADVLEDEVAALVAEIGEPALARPLDVSDEGQWLACIEEIETRSTKLFSIEEDDDAEAPANKDLEDTATDPSPYFSCSGFGSF